MRGVPNGFDLDGDLRVALALKGFTKPRKGCGLPMTGGAAAGSLACVAVRTPIMGGLA